MATTHIVHLNIDTVIAVREAQADTAHQRKAWLWLAEQTTARFAGDALVVDSATWDRTTYLATPTTCTCPARKGCWHRYAALTVIVALAEDAHYDAMADADLPFDLHADLADFPPTAVVRSGYKAALDDLLECYA